MLFPFICKFFYYLLSFVSIISYLLYTQISVVIQRFTTSEDVCWNIRNVKIKSFFFPEMRLYFLMFITVVCFLSFLEHLISLLFSIGTLSYESSFFSARFMARRPRAWAKTLGPRTRLITCLVKGVQHRLPACTHCVPTKPSSEIT